MPLIARSRHRILYVLVKRQLQGVELASEVMEPDEDVSLLRMSNLSSESLHESV